MREKDLPAGTGEQSESHGLTALARQSAEFRAKYAQLPGQLAATYEFEGLFDQFATRFRSLVQRMDGEPWNPTDPRIADDVTAVDDLRLDLYSRQSTQLPAYRDPLNVILQTSLRAASTTLYRLYGSRIQNGEVGDMTIHAMSLQRFDAQVAESKADIVRYRRELEARIDLEGTRLAELHDAVPRLVLAVLRSLLWKNWWRRLITSVTTVLLAWLVPPVQSAVAALWKWVGSLFS
jgi:hypothetical protein